MMSKYNELKSFQTPAFIYLEPELSPHGRARFRGLRRGRSEAVVFD